MNVFYTGEIQVVYKEQKYNMIFDTGSTDIFLNSVLCKDIGYQKGNQYNSTLSPTYKNIDAETYSYFGSGEIGGKMAIDTFFVSGQEVKKVQFFQITKDFGQAFESGQFDGLIGLAFPQLSGNQKTIVDYMKYQGLIKEKKFSFYLDRKNESKESYLDFGKVDKKIVDGEINYHQVANPLYWSILAEGFLLNDYDIGLCSNDHKCVLMIDSGTSLVTGPSQDMQILTQYLNDQGLQCKDISQMPTLTFIIDKIYYHIQPEEYVITFKGIEQSVYEHNKNPTECINGLLPMDIQDTLLDSFWIIGDLIMSKYLTIFDMDKLRVGFGKLKSYDKDFYEDLNFKKNILNFFFLIIKNYIQILGISKQSNLQFFHKKPA
ncbi:hypothetical protein IMG5_024830 [Ichthyophthirius multifiliis]|uniref:Peptidase A1 domain-containing protein n=1 Tax=Ichthyophthirius multifiliis TaxID=5932 RepID=G0QL38_ICHMU|nr:hypothetical protein IMG5_024830 [Ichthyophthirius multifiliis]EGR34063.1 hypothetical protein IMG5_024830 [Ichthyophthirius multifiliis]|eukprot:XP_004039367.1 hypothetical protein IMG5_024830 [Ichthyophthirius multifiliis]